METFILIIQPYKTIQLNFEPGTQSVTFNKNKRVMIKDHIPTSGKF